MKLIKEIKSKTGVVHFRRWELLKTPWFSIWLHGIYKEDQDEHLHNHPWDFISVVLWGSYLEALKTKVNTQFPGRINVRNGVGYHKILKLLTKTVYTLFFVTKPKREWGYCVDDKFVDNVTYREMKNAGKFSRNEKPVV